MNLDETFPYLRVDVKFPLSTIEKTWYEGFGFPDEPNRDPRETTEVRQKMVELRFKDCPHSELSFNQMMTFIDDIWETKTRKELLERAILECQKII